MSSRFDPDQLLSLALSNVRRRCLAVVRAPEEILASARAARARAVQTRTESHASRGRSRATFAEAIKSRERLQDSQREHERREQEPP